MNTILATLYVVTLNIWGLPDVGFKVLSPLREERVAHICEELRTASQNPVGWDVVLLQEVWVKSDREKLKTCGYSYFVDREDHNVALDTGLLILSRYPILESEKMTFPTIPKNGEEFENGEAFAHKGALFAKIKHANNGVFWVANTHLVSFYNGKDIYLEHRKRQFKKFVDYAKSRAAKDALIVGGDLNFGPTFPMWADIEQNIPGFVEFSNQSCTICPPNTMHKTNEGKVDHLFASEGSIALEGGLAFTKAIEFTNFKISPSDHFGWETKFQAKLSTP